MNEFLHGETIDQLVKLRKDMKAQGLYYLEDMITAELQARGFYDVPRVCSCQEYAGDDPACPIHKEQA